MILFWFCDLLDECFEEGVDYYGHDFSKPKVQNPADCQKECAKNSACNYWTYVRSSKNHGCHLKRAKGVESTNHGLDLISGPKFCSKYKNIIFLRKNLEIK